MVKETMNADAIVKEGPQKTNSFLLSGNKPIDYMALEIDAGYVECLEKVKHRMEPS